MSQEQVVRCFDVSWEHTRPSYCDEGRVWSLRTIIIRFHNNLCLPFLHHNNYKSCFYQPTLSFKTGLLMQDTKSPFFGAGTHPAR